MRIAVRAMRLSCVAAPVWPEVFRFHEKTKKTKNASGAPGAASELLRRHGTSESNRALAGSLLTLLSGMPVAAEVSNERTGADGHVEIVLPRPSRIYGPDSAAMQLSAGVFASHVQA